MDCKKCGKPIRLYCENCNSHFDDYITASNHVTYKECGNNDKVKIIPHKDSCNLLV